MKYIKSEDFPSALLSFLKETEQTQTEFARKLGIPKQTINNWIKGRSMPGHKTFEKIMEMMEESEK